MHDYDIIWGFVRTLCRVNDDSYGVFSQAKSEGACNISKNISRSLLFIGLSGDHLPGFWKYLRWYIHLVCENFCFERVYSKTMVLASRRDVTKPPLQRCSTHTRRYKKHIKSGGCLGGFWENLNLAWWGLCSSWSEKFLITRIFVSTHLQSSRTPLKRTTCVALIVLHNKKCLLGLG